MLYIPDPLSISEQVGEKSDRFRQSRQRDYVRGSVMRMRLSGNCSTGTRYIYDLKVDPISLLSTWVWLQGDPYIVKIKEKKYVILGMQ
jgi:hypothetical protein